MIIYSFFLIHESSHFKYQVAIFLGTIAKIGMRGFLEDQTCNQIYLSLIKIVPFKFQLTFPSRNRKSIVAWKIDNKCNISFGKSLIIAIIPLVDFYLILGYDVHNTVFMIYNSSPILGFQRRTRCIMKVIQTIIIRLNSIKSIEMHFRFLKDLQKYLIFPLPPFPFRFDRPRQRSVNDLFLFWHFPRML